MNKTSPVIFIIFSLFFTTCSSTSSVFQNMIGKDISEKLRNQLLSAKPGSEIIIPEGTYLLSGDFSVPSGVRLAGRGSGMTKLNSLDGTVFLIENVSNVTLQGVSLSSTDGHCSVRVRSGKPKEKRSARPVDNIQLLDINIDNTALLGNWRKGEHGIFVKAMGNENVTNILIRDCVVTGAPGNSVLEGKDNCYVGSYDSDGLGQVRDVHIENCKFSRAGRQNLSVAGKGKSKPVRVTIKSCNFFDSSLAGIDLEEASKVLIEQCSFKGNGHYERYFSHNVKRNSMRSGLMVHNTDVQIKDCNFTDCFYGYSSVNTQDDGVRFTDCTFVNAPLSRGSSAGMANTTYQNCDLISDEGSLINFYRSSFTFSNCTFKALSQSPMMIIGGGGPKALKHGKATFNECTFQGQGGGMAILDYETIYFNQCDFYSFNSLFATSGPNRNNHIALKSPNLNDIQTIGSFTTKAFRRLEIQNGRGEVYSTLLTVRAVNGELIIRGNEFILSSLGADVSGVQKIELIDNRFMLPSQQFSEEMSGISRPEVPLFWGGVKHEILTKNNEVIVPKGTLPLIKRR